MASSISSKLSIQLPSEDPPEVSTGAISARCQFLNPEGSTICYETRGILGDGGAGVIVRVVTPSGRPAAMKIPHHSESCAKLSLHEWKILNLIKGARHVLPGERDFYLSHLYFTDENGKFRIDPDEVKLKRHSHAFIMPLLPCPNTYEMFLTTQKTTVLSFDEIMDIQRQGFEALLDLRRKNVVHCDIKPENIVYDPKAKKFIMYDFGAAQIEPIDPRKMTGTYSYLTLEQLLGQDLDPSIDVWAFGLTLFELYTGYPLIPVATKNNPKQAFIDYLHILTLNLGPLPATMTQTAPSFFKEDGSINGSPSKKQESILRYIRTIGARYPDILPWQAYIYCAARKKGEPIDLAKRLVTSLEPMLRYENRITPEEFFKLH